MDPRFIHLHLHTEYSLVDGLVGVKPLVKALRKAGIDKGLSLEAIKEGFDVPFYKEWTGKESKAQSENIEHVFKELSSPGKPLGLKSRLHRHPHPHPSQPVVGTVGSKR